MCLKLSPVKPIYMPFVSNVSNWTGPEESIGWGLAHLVIGQTIRPEYNPQAFKIGAQYEPNQIGSWRAQVGPAMNTPNCDVM